MKKHIAIFASIAVVVAACTTKSKHAEQSNFVIPPMVSDVPADPAAGEKLASSGNANGLASCTSCHGASGAGNPAGGFPRLASLSRMYLTSQLQAFRDGSRDNPIMMPIAKAMTAQDVQNVGAYYESLKDVPYVRMPAANTARTARGKLLAETGDQGARVQSCANCHGPGGMGMPPNIPYLKGQSSAYIEAQLQAWKTEHRRTSDEHMALIAKLLNDSDIKAVAAYFQEVSNAEQKP